MAITRIEIEGFKSFRKLDFELKPLNVLIGPNGCGKTNFIDFFKFLREAANDDMNEAYLRRGGGSAFVFKGKHEPSATLLGEDESLKAGLNFHPLWAGNLPDIKGMYSLSLWPFPASLLPNQEKFEGISGDKITLSVQTELGLMLNPEARSLEISAKSVVRVPPLPLQKEREVFSWIGETIRNWASYDPIDTGPGSAVRNPDLARSGINLRADGSNLTSVLHNMQSLSEGEEAYQRIEEVLQQVFPGFKRLSFPAEGGEGRLLLSWKEAPFEKDGFSITFLSDGTIRFLCLLAIFLCPAPPPLILIEEPELGLHPDMLLYLAALAQEASDRTQIIMTTHSPELVSALELEDVVVVEKVDGTTEMRRLSDRPTLAAWLKDFSLGELWQMGEIGGRP